MRGYVSSLCHARGAELGVSCCGTGSSPLIISIMNHPRSLSTQNLKNNHLNIISNHNTPTPTRSAVWRGLPLGLGTRVQNTYHVTCLVTFFSCLPPACSCHRQHRGSRPRTRGTCLSHIVAVTRCFGGEPPYWLSRRPWLDGWLRLAQPSQPSLGHVTDQRGSMALQKEMAAGVAIPWW